MNLLRLIILALAIWIAYRIWQNYRSSKNKMPQSTKNRPAIPDMVACSACQTHIPENEALQKNGKFYCSQQHLDDDN